MAQFLAERERGSSASCKIDLHTQGSKALAVAINDELADHQDERIAMQRSRSELQASLAHLSHDIRTPLTGARGYVQLMESEEDEEIRMRYHEAVVRRLDDLNDMLDQLFTFTQVNDVEYHLDVDKIDANEVLAEVLLALFPQFQEKGSEPVLLIEEENMVVADTEALTRIMQNLISNSLRHGSGALRVEQQGSCYVFSNRVDDPAAIDVDRLFERFYKSDSTRSGQGSGLGLAIVSQLSGAMGATVSAHLEGDTLSIKLCLKAVS